MHDASILVWCCAKMLPKDMIKSRLRCVTDGVGDINDWLLGAAQQPGGTIHPSLDQLFLKSHSIGILQHPGELSAGKVQILSKVAGRDILREMSFKETINSGRARCLFCVASGDGAFRKMQIAKQMQDYQRQIGLDKGLLKGAGRGLFLE